MTSNAKQDALGRDLHSVIKNEMPTELTELQSRYFHTIIEDIDELQAIDTPASHKQAFKQLNLLINVFKATTIEEVNAAATEAWNAKGAAQMAEGLDLT